MPTDAAPPAIADERYRERLGQATKGLRERGLAALIVVGEPSELFMQATSQAYVRYLVGLSGRFAPTAVVLAADGRVVVVGADAADPEYIRELRPWLRDVRSASQPWLGRALRAVLRDLELGRGAVGLIGAERLPHAAYADLLAEPDELSFGPAAEVIDRLRLTKEPEEVALHRHAGRLVDAMYEVLVEQAAGTGRSVEATRTDMEYAARRRGAQRATPWLTTGPAPRRLPFRDQGQGLRFERGQQIVSGTYAVYEGYYGHAVRMGFKGRPTREAERLYAVVRESMEAAIAAIRPGVGTAAVREAAEGVLFRAFPPDPQRFRVAHFLGLEYSEPPTDRAFPQPWSMTYAPPAPAPEDIPLAAGMLLEIHPNLRVDDLGYCAIGDMVLVTPDGCERLTHFPLDHFVVP